MSDWTCADCGSAWAPGAPACPECRSTQHLEQRDGGEQVHPGYGEEMHGIELPADGTVSPPLSNDEPAGGEPFTVEGGFAGPSSLDVLKVPAEGAEAEAEAEAPEDASAAPAPRTPPWREQ